MVLQTIVVSKPNRDNFDQVITTIKDWLKSFSQPKFCETKEEYCILKSSLYQYINSPSVLDALKNITNVKRVHEWVQNNARVWGKYF